MLMFIVFLDVAFGIIGASLLISGAIGMYKDWKIEKENKKNDK